LRIRKAMERERGISSSFYFKRLKEMAKTALVADECNIRRQKRLGI